jgi:mono/diheme cytochrome c family protein
LKAWLATAGLALTLAVASAVAFSWVEPARAQPGPASKSSQGALLPKDSNDAATFRGGLVFANYCVTCHGMNADGNGRAAKLYNPRPANLRMSDKNDAYYGLIIRKGGAMLGRSEFMPAWDAELTDEQIGDLVAYLRSINARKANA